MSNYPLYDVPYLVREPNDTFMSLLRHKVEVFNQRDKGVPAHEARRQVAGKHGITTKRFHYIAVWFYREAKKRRKYDFLEKFFTPDGTLK